MPPGGWNGGAGPANPGGAGLAQWLGLPVSGPGGLLGRLGKCRGLNRIERGRKSARESVWGRAGGVSGA